MRKVEKEVRRNEIEGKLMEGGSRGRGWTREEDKRRIEEELRR